MAESTDTNQQKSEREVAIEKARAYLSAEETGQGPRAKAIKEVKEIIDTGDAETLASMGLALETITWEVNLSGSQATGGIASQVKSEELNKADLRMVEKAREIAEENNYSPDFCLKTSANAVLLKQVISSFNENLGDWLHYQPERESYKTSKVSQALYVLAVIADRLARKQLIPIEKAEFFPKVVTKEINYPEK